MRLKILTTWIAFLIGLTIISCSGQRTITDNNKEYPNPERFEESIQHFETMDSKNNPPQDAIVCVGSSSMRGWRDSIKEDLAPLTVIPRGFGGSNMNDLLYYTDRIVLSYKPRAIVIYEGDNDIEQGIGPKKIRDTFRFFVTKVHGELPTCRIYCLSIKPSIKRWNMWPQMKEANILLAAECAKDKRLTYVDVASGMLDGNGNPLKTIYQDDDLHMTRDGYMVWKDAVRPVLLEAELEFESGENQKKE